MALKTREDLLETLRDSKLNLERRFKVQRFALFGSWARGDQRPGSDVDILVEVDPSVGLDFVILANTLEQLVGMSVELVSRRAVSPRHWKYIEDELIDV